MFGNITAGWNGGLCTCSFLYRYLDANAVSFVVFCLHVHFEIRPTIAHMWRTYVRFGFLVARSHLPVHRRTRALLQSRVHVQLLPVPPPPLHRIRAHLHTRANTSRVRSSGRENLHAYPSAWSSIPQSVAVNPNMLPALPQCTLPPRRNETRTFVPLHPSLYAASFATSSPNPSISPLTKGRRRLIAAPRIRPQNVGGEYRISGELLDGGEGECSSE